MFAIPRFCFSKSAVLGLGVLAAITALSAAQAQDTYDAQIPFSFSSLTLVSPQGVAVAANGTFYIADPSVGVVQIVPTTGDVGGTAKAAASIASTATTLDTGLTAPAAVAVDSNGNLYAADATDGKVIELPNPVTSSTPVTITYATGETPTALAVDPNNNLYIADEAKRAIYKVLSGATTGTKLAITLPANGDGTTPALKPVGLAADSSGDVYFANDNNRVYEYTASTGVTAVFLETPGAGAWDFSGTNAKFPIGMGLDPAGDLYVMDSGSGNLIEITPAAANNYQLPLTPTVTATGMAVSSIGNLYIADNAGKTADEIFYNNNPFNFGMLPAGTNSAAVTVNFLFSSHAHDPVLYQSMQGGVITEFSSTETATEIGNDCGSPAASCSLAFYVNYSSSYPGTQNAVVGLTDNAHDLLVVPSTGIAEASALALYPGTQSTLPQTSLPLYEPQSLAVTGNGGTLFVADEGGVRSGSSVSYSGSVWEYTMTAGVSGSTRTQVGSFTTPDAVALDARGDLFVADYGGSNGTTPSVTEIPIAYSSSAGNTWPGYGTALTLTGSVALSHPMALAFDPSGNLYIGDMGPAGVNATASNPGYIIKVPADGGPAVKLSYTVGVVPIVFPTALAFDSYGNLYIADGGDGDTDQGGVDVVPVATGTPVAISFSSVPPALNGPSGLGFDAANDLYVLDSYNYRVLVVPMTYSGTVPTADTADISLLGQGDSGLSTLVTPSNMVVWPGGQYLSISDIGYQPQSGTSTAPEVYTLKSINETADASSGPVSFTGVNVGNETIDFLTPGNTNKTSFSFTGCGSASGTTLATGVAPNCSPTVTFTGTATQNTTITINGNSTTDYSALGNEIYVTAEPNEPIASLDSPTFSFSPNVTATLSNTGNQPLDISNIQVTGNATLAAGGTCSTVTPLPANSSCTINFTINGDFSTGTVNVTDNSGNVSGSVQTTSTFYLFSFSLVTKAGGANLSLTPADVPRDLLDENTSSTSNNPIQPTNTKGGKRSNR